MKPLNRPLGVRHVFKPPGAPVVPLDDLDRVPEKDKKPPLYKEGKICSKGKYSRTLLIKYLNT
ncbi:hypothetical protein Hanom_Chr16g01479201 [Helianthus anomalus]